MVRTLSEQPKHEPVRRQQKLSRNTIPKRQLPVREPVYRVEVLYKDLDYTTPRMRYDNCKLGGMFIQTNLFCPRLKDGDYTFAFTLHGLTQYMPVIKAWLSDTERYALAYCELFVYEINQSSKVVFSDKTQVAFKGKFNRKQHELITRIMVVQNLLQDHSN